jgi:hypothetical protein
MSPKCWATINALTTFGPTAPQHGGLSQTGIDLNQRQGVAQQYVLALYVDTAVFQRVHHPA